MLAAEGRNRIIARQFADSLREVLGDCSHQVDDLQNSFQRGPMGTANEASEFASKMANEANQLYAQLPQLVDLVRDTPRLDQILDAGFEQLQAINSILDIYEGRLEEAYNISPVKLDSPDKSVGATKSQPVSFRTPSKTPSTLRRNYNPNDKIQDEDIPIPVTPRLEDFGISAADLRVLKHRTPDQDRVRNRDEGMDQKVLSILTNTHGNDYGNNVLEAMSTLGIETPAEITQRFEAKRYTAMKGLMQSCTPRVKGEGVEKALAYANLADEYNRPPIMDEENEINVPGTSRKTLTFDESPIPGRKNERSADEIRLHVGKKLDASKAYWVNMVDRSVIQDAAAAFAGEQGRVFTRPQLAELLKDVVQAKHYNEIMLLLVKMKVLKLDISKTGNFYHVL